MHDISRACFGAAVWARTGLSQRGFAGVYRFEIARLRDLEQGRIQPDSATLAYLTVIAREPEVVERALQEDTAA
jgi:putative transcriptional regulator